MKFLKNDLIKKYFFYFAKTSSPFILYSQTISTNTEKKIKIEELCL